MLKLFCSDQEDPLHNSTFPIERPELVGFAPPIAKAEVSARVAVKLILYQPPGYATTETLVGLDAPLLVLMDVVSVEGR